MWSEARSSLREAAWRGAVSRGEAEIVLNLIETAPVRAAGHPRLGYEAWTLAERLGWAKTYDAEYVALASLLRCRLVTLDARLHRGTSSLGFVVGPTEV